MHSFLQHHFILAFFKSNFGIYLVEVLNGFRNYLVFSQHVVFGICRLIDILVPDIPESLELKIKRERYLAKQALQDSESIMKVISNLPAHLVSACCFHSAFCFCFLKQLTQAMPSVLITVTYFMQVAAGVEESIDISGRMVLDLTAELGGGDTSPQCVLFPTVSAKILTSSLPSPSGSEPPTIPIQLNSLPPHLPPRRSVTSLNIHQPPSRTIERSRPRPKSQTS